MRFANEDLDDLVILRADGSPIYNLAVVSDDAEQGITHVIRGDDHLSNTPKQILIYEALGLAVPVFGHVPMILGADGKRLSKRHGATAVGDYADQGVLPDAMVNFLALLGWNPGDEREVMSRDELVAAFSMERVQKKSAVFDLEKLAWFNGQYLSAMPSEELLPLVAQAMANAGREPGPSHAPEDWPGTPESWWSALVELLKLRARSVLDIVEQATPFLEDVREYDEKTLAKQWGREPAAVHERLADLTARLQTASWEEEGLETLLRELASAREVGAGKLIHPLRLAVTGRGNSPGIFEVLVLLGRAETLNRLVIAGEHLARMADGSA